MMICKAGIGIITNLITGIVITTYKVVVDHIMIDHIIDSIPRLGIFKLVESDAEVIVSLTIQNEVEVKAHQERERSIKDQNQRNEIL
jgi:hypothetical protein